MRNIPYPYAIIGSAAALVVGLAVYFVGKGYLKHKKLDQREYYRRKHLLGTVIPVAVVLIWIGLWARLIPNASTFLGLVGAGAAIALREPLLSIAARISIFAGHMYTAGDRVQLNQITGDVIHVSFFYTRMMEVGNWISGDQATGRVVQFSNSMIYGTPIFNYTRDFHYIWDEIKLPVTYDTNIKEVSNILLAAGKKYTSEFLKDAGKELEEMRKYFLVPSVELEPAVFLKVTSNWVELALRYVVDPKKRRSASNFIYTDILEKLQEHDDITIASETMDLTIHAPAKQFHRATDGATPH